MYFRHYRVNFNSSDNNDISKSYFTNITDSDSK